jgi:hypothetical protein
MPDQKRFESASAVSQPKRRRIRPQSAQGWIAIGLGLVALCSWVIFPMVTIAYRETYPVVDTWVMPAIATTLVDVAAVLSVATVWLRRERSILSIVILVITSLAGLFFTVLVLGEAIGSA